MAVIRTVFVPLSREPEVMFGLKLSDLLWPTAAALTSLTIWHEWKVTPTARLAMSALVMATGMALAMVRIEETSLPQWMLRFLSFWLKVRLYLP